MGDAGVVGVGVASSAAAMEAATVSCAASCEEAAAASALALDAPDDDDAAAEVAAAEGWGLGGSTSSLLPYAILLASWAVALLPSSTRGVPGPTVPYWTPALAAAVGSTSALPLPTVGGT